jgi:hypothetical protein
MPILPDACPCPAPDVYFWEQPDQSEIILVKSLQQFRVLNSSAAWIWKLCDGFHSRQDLLAAMQDYFSEADPEDLAGDLDEFLADLLRQDYLCIPG